MLSGTRHHLHKLWSILIHAVDVLSLNHGDIEIANIIVEVHTKHFDGEHERRSWWIDGDGSFNRIEQQLRSGAPSDDFHVEGLDGRAHEEGHENHDHD